MPDETRPSEAPSANAGSRDLPPQVSLGMALLAEGLQRGLAWARRSIVEPHTAHAVVTEHPDCVLCVAMVAIQGASEGAFPQSGREPAPPAPRDDAARPIHWVPVRRHSPGNADSP